MDTSLIAKYLAGESNNREKKKVEQWLQTDPKNQRLMKEFKRIWEASDKGSEQFQSHFDPTEDWDQLRSRILRESGEYEAVHSSDFHFNKGYSRTNKSNSTQFLRVAVIILVASLLGVLAYEHLYQQPEVAEPTLREISMDKGQRGNITLSDGTKVTLNAESKIILPNVFESEKREVTLEGEAFLMFLTTRTVLLLFIQRKQSLKCWGPLLIFDPIRRTVQYRLLLRKDRFL